LNWSRSFNWYDISATTGGNHSNNRYHRNHCGTKTTKQQPLGDAAG
jgi:hypothetical protein